MKAIFLFLLLIFFLTSYNIKAQDAEVLKYSTDAKINTKGKLIVITSFVIQINNRRGEDLTHFSYRSSKREKVSNVQANITNLEGTVLNELDRKEIKKVSAFSDISFFEDDFYSFFVLRHNTYPYIINFTYTSESDEFYGIVDWNPIYNRDYPVKNAALILTIPANYKVRIKEFEIQSSNTVDEKGNLIYKWESSYTQILKWEQKSPDIDEILPRVMIVPENFKYGIAGSNESWSTYGQWEENLMTGLNDLPQTEKDKVDNIIKGISDKKEKVKLLYKYMQDNTRYINVRLGIGGMKPFPASYVAYNKYGDCKALSNYMKSLLEVAGIKSYCADIYADETISKIITDFPSQQFNHVFLMVPMDHDTIWLECTSQNKPFGYVGINTQNRTAFIINNEKSNLVNTPALKDNDVLTCLNTTVNVNLTGKSKTQINYLCRGETFEFFKDISKEMTSKEQEDYIKDILHFSDFELLNWSFEKMDRDSTSITLDIEIESADLCKKYSDDYVLNAITPNLAKFENPKDRKLPLVFNYPIWKKNTSTFNLPEFAKIHFLPTDTLISNKFGQYEVHFSKTDRSISVTYSLKLNNGRYNLEDYPAFYDFMKNIQTIERKNHPIIAL